MQCVLGPVPSTALKEHTRNGPYPPRNEEVGKTDVKTLQLTMGDVICGAVQGAVGKMPLASPTLGEARGHGYHQLVQLSRLSKELTGPLGPAFPLAWAVW